MIEPDAPLVAASLFSGIGGIDRGLELAGIPTVFQSEIDPAAQRVLADHWPTVTRAGDVREVTADDIRAAAPRGARFVLTAGFPCQDVSVAGRRAGVAEGTRSGLYVEVVRLAEELDPDWLVVENVPGLLTADVDPDVNGGAECTAQRRRSHHKCQHPVRPATGSPHGYGPGTAFAVVLRDLTGYMPAIPDGGWRSSGICAGPRRTAAWRVLDAQHFGVAQRRRRVFVVCHARDRAAPGAVLLEPEGMRWDPAPRRSSWQSAAAPAARGAVRDRGTDADRGRADGVSAERVNALTRNGLGGGGPDDNHLVAFDAASEDGTGRGTPLAFHVTQDPISGDVAPAMGAGNGQGCSTIGVLTELAMRGREGGSQVESGGDKAFTLRAGDGGSSRSAALRVDSAVRRLTPRECERLQGFPDDWTLVSGSSDSSRYRQLGNAVCCNVAEWQGHRMVAYEAQRAD